MKVTRSQAGVAVIIVVVALAAVYYAYLGMQPSEAYRVAILFPGRIDDVSWNQEAYESMLRLQEELPDVQFDWVEDVYLPVDIEPSLRDYANQGYDLVIGHGFQFIEPVIAVSASYPDTVFISVQGYIPDSAPPNMAICDVRTDQSGYLMGVLAARVTASGRIRFLDGFDVGRIHRYWLGFQEGVASVESGVDLGAVFLDWQDIEGARTAVRGMSGIGVDIVSIMGDGVTLGATTTAAEEGLFIIGNGVDTRVLGGELVLTSTIHRWDVVWKQAIEDQRAGTFGNKIYWIDFANGGLALSEYSDDVPAGVISEIEVLKAQMIAGELLPDPLS